MAKDIPTAVRKAVADRASDTQSMAPVCEALIRGVCGIRPSHWHHRLMRSQGGPHTVENGLYVCNSCHGYIHENPSKSYEMGWLVRRDHSPLDTPVFRRRKKVLLTQGGNVMKAIGITEEELQRGIAYRGHGCGDPNHCVQVPYDLIDSAKSLDEIGEWILNKRKGVKCAESE